MKNNTEKQNKVELSYRMAQRRLHRGLKMSSIVMVLSMVTVLFPIVPLGHASDICLQVPSEYTMPSIEERASSTVILTYNESDETGETVDPLEADTFVISEHDDRDGVSVEMLDPSAFESRNDVVYALKNMVVHASPSSESSSVGKLLYAEQAVRDGQGSSWSHIVYETEEGTISGFVLTQNITLDVVATPTPTPTETPTPTPTPKKKSTPTPSPTPAASSQSSESKPKATPTPEPVVSETELSGTFYSNGDVNVRSGPGTGYSVARKLVRDEAVTVVARTSNGWYKLSDGGYVRSDLVRDKLETSAPEVTATPAPASTSTSEPSTTTAPSSGTNTNPSIPNPSSCDLLTYARAFIGIPYVYTGASLQGLDCSGFVMYVYAHYYGISLPHQSASIAQLGTDVTNQELKPGDVICHDYRGDGKVDHVSLYCGSGVVIHASTSNGGIVEDCIPMSCVVCVRRFV
ncbi:MAG: C40 family peptidase [Clostridiales bacterium]|nr:C40 family peptidase [Clostridiales bacterium]MBR4819063.1 C40 family peptidase [Clostridiales bacterium]MBR5040384.1 C40 family peptidase [Clostridiales bacterium]MBR5058773.1 C40 family peptidase [Clostridiales bacterium]